MLTTISSYASLLFIQAIFALLGLIIGSGFDGRVLIFVSIIIIISCCRAYHLKRSSRVNHTSGRSVNSQLPPTDSLSVSYQYSHH